MIVSFLFAVIAFITITLKNIVSFNSYESSSVYEIETTCTTSETLTTTCSTSTNTLTTSTHTQTSSTAIETSQTITSKHISSETTTTTTLASNDQIIAITNYQIVVIPDETTVLTTTTTSAQINEATTAVTYGNEDVRSSANFVKTFTMGTYYLGWEAYGSTQLSGGSGRLLMDCSIKDDEIKGSVACKYIQEKYGYNYNGARTIVYLDIPEVPNMSGFYSVDDSCLRDDTIDFYFTYKANCPFMDQGVLKTITCYIVPNGGNC
jgi:hypothetical protein